VIVQKTFRTSFNVFICTGQHFGMFFRLIIKDCPNSTPGGNATASTPTQANWWRWRSFVLTIRLTATLALTVALSHPTMAQDAPSGNLSNLTVANFFSDGWDQVWVKRPNPGGAPDLALLRVQTNFLAQYFRADFFTEQGLNSSKNRTMDLYDVVMGKSLNRRLMISATAYYEWLQSRVHNDTDASSFALAGRLQLIDIPGSAYDLNLKVISPAKDVGNDLTTITYSLAGWQDLTPYGLNRVGLYFSVQGDNYAGPHPIGSKETDVAYDVSLAKTWTEPNAALQNFTTFAELYGQTDLSGSTSGKTVFTLTPGFRAGIGHNQILMAGVDLPVSHPRPYNWALRLAYILDY
jgi:hypothetical protein